MTLDVMTTYNVQTQDLKWHKTIKQMIGCLDIRGSMNTFSWVPSSQ